MMKRWLLALLLLVVGSLSADPQFWIGQAGKAPITGVVVDITTTPYNAVCNGTTSDDAPKFLAFNNDYQNWPVPVTLFIPSGKTCCIMTDVLGGIGANSINIARGIPDITISMYGAKITDTCNSVVGAGYFISINGYPQNGSADAQTQSVSAGASCVSMLNLGDYAKFTAGHWSVMTNDDLEGQAVPLTVGQFEYLKIASVSPDVGATPGQVCFTTPLVSTYLSTYPTFFPGPPPGGGPAWLFQFSTTWDQSIVVQGGTLNEGGIIYTQARNVQYTDVTTGGPNISCLIPTTSKTVTYLRTNASSCTPSIEVDKLVDDIIVDNSTMYQWTYQTGAGAVHNTHIKNGSVFTGGLVGNSGNTYCDNSTIAGLSLGAASFGASNLFSGNNCVIQADLGIGNHEVMSRRFYFSSAGVLATPFSTNVTNAADNGSGFMRVTVTNSSGYPAGLLIGIQNVVGATCINGDHTITAQNVGAHTFDLDVASAGCGAYSSGGLAFGQYPMQYAQQGATWFWDGQLTYEGSFHIVSPYVTFDAVNNYIHTDFAGSSFPTLPGSATMNFKPDPMPNWSCTGCTGSNDAVDYSQAAAQGKPIYTATKRTYTCLANIPNITVGPGLPPVIDINNAPSTPSIWGAPIAGTAMTIDVTKADTSATGTVNWFPFDTVGAPYVSVATPGTSARYAARVDLKIQHTITVAASGTPGGTMGNDSVTNLSDVTTFSGLSGPGNLAVTNSAATCPVVTLSVQTTR